MRVSSGATLKADATLRPNSIVSAIFSLPPCSDPAPASITNARSSFDEQTNNNRV